jgi:hypothetical protein
VQLFSIASLGGAAGAGHTFPKSSAFIASATCCSFCFTCGGVAVRTAQQCRG